MGSFTLVTSLPKFGHAGAAIARARTWNPRVFAAATPRPIQVPSSGGDQGDGSGPKHAANETVNAVGDQNMQDKAYSSSAHQERAGQESASSQAQNIADKAKQTMQEAWDSTKNTAQKAADTVMGKAQDTAESVKQNAESVKNSMNTKN